MEEVTVFVATLLQCDCCTCNLFLSRLFTWNPLGGRLVMWLPQRLRSISCFAPEKAWGWMDLMAFRSKLMLSILGIDLRALAFRSVIPFSPLDSSKKVGYQCSYPPQCLCLLTVNVRQVSITLQRSLVVTQFEDPGIRGQFGGKGTKPPLMTVDL